MASTYVLRYPDGAERLVSVDTILSADKVLSLRPPLSGKDVLSEAERLYATGTAPDGATLKRYRVKAVMQEPQERVYGKVEVISVAVLDDYDDA